MRDSKIVVETNKNLKLPEINNRFQTPQHHIENEIQYSGLRRPSITENSGIHKKSILKNKNVSLTDNRLLEKSERTNLKIESQGSAEK